jgi:hypothetical protein
MANLQPGENLIDIASGQDSSVFPQLRKLDQRFCFGYRHFRWYGKRSARNSDRKKIRNILFKEWMQSN